jgi:hypothetical protein
LTERLNMMSRSDVRTIVALALAALLCSGAAADPKPEAAPAEEKPALVPDTPPGPVTIPVIDAKTAATPRYLPVEFTTHDEHAKRLGGKCGRCHHNDDSAQGKPKACAACHATPEAKTALVDAYHQQCRGCHKAEKKKNKDTVAPTKCLGCHKERGAK